MTTPLISSEAFRLRADETVDLAERATRIEPVYSSESDYKSLIETHVAALSELQQLHTASARCAVLLIFQGMDASGKDGSIRHVMSGVSPSGCEVFSFKQPSAQALQHDFLWRTTCDLPERGRIGIFNRSYYEEVLVARVHPAVLEAQNLPVALLHDTAIWTGRYRSIRDMEQHLAANGTKIVKFYLHLSKDEQKKRFLERLDTPNKHWKLSPSDIEERAFWPQYMTAYEECLNQTSTTDSPWYIVPADDKNMARLIVSQVILDTLEGLHMTYPEESPQRAGDLIEMRRKLLA